MKKIICNISTPDGPKTIHVDYEFNNFVKNEIIINSICVDEDLPILEEDCNPDTIKQIKDFLRNCQEHNSSPFQSTHKLEFLAKIWRIDPEYIQFKVGTCNGIYRYIMDTIEILAIQNDNPGNGHFEDVLEWFYNSAKRDNKHLQFSEILNPKFAKHLEDKRGFKIMDKGTKAVKLNCEIK